MNKNSNGFTIIELIVVVMIIAILIAIAIPAFYQGKEEGIGRRSPEQLVTSYCDEHGNRVYTRRGVHGHPPQIYVVKEDC